MAHPGGRPLKFKTVSDLKQKIDDYFADCDPHMVELTEWVQARDNKGSLKKDSYGQSYLVELTHRVISTQLPYTITGLALALSTSRETLIDYESGIHDAKDEEALEYSQFSDAIKEAKLRCQNYNERMLYGSSPTGPIFNLKNNYGWRDKTEVDQNNSGEVIIKTVSYKDSNSGTNDTV